MPHFASTWTENLVFSGFFCAVDHPDFDRSSSSLQFQSKIFLKHCRQVGKVNRFRTRLRTEVRCRLIRSPWTRADLEESFYSRLVHDPAVRKAGEVLSK